MSEERSIHRIPSGVDNYGVNQLKNLASRLEAHIIQLEKERANDALVLRDTQDKFNCLNKAYNDLKSSNETLLNTEATAEKELVKFKADYDKLYNIILIVH